MQRGKISASSYAKKYLKKYTAHRVRQQCKVGNTYEPSFGCCERNYFKKVYDIWNIF